MSALPLIRPLQFAAEGSLAAAHAARDARLGSILPSEALHFPSHPAGTMLPGRAPAGASGGLTAADFTTTGPEARAILDRVLGGDGALVTTGQQPGLFLGPLYTLYKALSASELAARLERLWEVPVLPVFWVASDDHDWDEVATARILDASGEIRTLHLEPPAGHAGRSVGTAATTEAVRSLLEQVERSLEGLAFTDVYMDWLKSAYTPGRTLGRAFIETLTGILGGRHFALIDAGSAAVRRASASVARRALIEQAATEVAVREGADRLESAGFPATIPALPGASCLFMDTAAGRTRLYVRDGVVSEGRAGPATSLDSVLRTLDRQPELFSPNVALRPVLESSLMPVAATVLGPGELGYWAQLPDMFRLFDVAMPALRSRLAWTILEPGPERALEKLGALPEDVADGGTVLIERLIADERPAAVEAAMSDLRAALETGLDRLDVAVGTELPGLRSAAGKARAEAGKALESFDRSVDRRLRERLSVMRERASLAALHLYPEGIAQERFYTPITFLARYGPDLVSAIDEAGHSAVWPGGPDVAPMDEPA